MKIVKSNIHLPVQSTDYITGSDLLANLHLLDQLKNNNYSSFLLLTDNNIFNLYGERVITSLKKLNKPVITSLVVPGEKSKDLSVIPKIVKPFFQKGFDRKAAVVALGGGVITDLGGFIASILMRGIDAIYLPTTLLGQIDAAIGGKTGVDLFLPDSFMLKNMLGTIVQPKMVISDVDVLLTLPKREILNGLGEMTKYWVGWKSPTPEQMKTIKAPLGWQAEVTTQAMIPPMAEELVTTISLCQKIKIDIIQKDPFEKTGLRHKLNLGHTIGHAVEGAVKGKLSHGNAVAIGLVAAAWISVKKKMLSEEIFRQISNTLTILGLPTKIIFSQYSITRSDLVSAVNKTLKLDKKGGTFVLIDDIGKLQTGVSVEEKIVQQVLTEIITY